MSSLFDFGKAPDLYAVMGNPVSHSKSPQIHAAFARQTRQHIEYRAIQVDEGGFAQAVGNFQANDGKGLNVTVPFKQEAWQLVNERSALADQAGAVNTIIFRDNNHLYGDNTDGIGLVRDLTINHGCVLHHKRILIMGAGGAVRGVLAPLLDEQPALLTIVNRTVEKAVTLARDFAGAIPVVACGYESLEGQFDIIINGTSASLHGQLPPLAAMSLAAQCWCYDMMYGHAQTVFLDWAEQQGVAQRVDGLGMLVEQAAASFELWRGVRPDTAPVIETLRGQR